MNEKHLIYNYFLKYIFQSLLKSESFHKSMLACCYELLYTYSDITLVYLNKSSKTLKLSKFLFDQQEEKELKFPWCLHALNVAPFDFLRIIECFIRTTSNTTSTTTTTTTTTTILNKTKSDNEQQQQMSSASLTSMFLLNKGEFFFNL